MRDFLFIFKNRFNRHINFPLATINKWNSKISFFARAFQAVKLSPSGMHIYIAKRQHCVLVGNRFSQTSHSTQGSTIGTHTGSRPCKEHLCGSRENFLRRQGWGTTINTMFTGPNCLTSESTKPVLFNTIPLSSSQGERETVNNSISFFQKISGHCFVVTKKKNNKITKQ